MYCEALAQYDYLKIKWCNRYIQELREIILLKYDEISAHILTYIENYTKYTDQELQAMASRDMHARKIDSNMKQEFNLKEFTVDLQFGIWANVMGKNFPIKRVVTDNYEQRIPFQH